MLHALLALLVCQVTGEGIARITAVPVPGPVIGLVLMLVFLGLRRRVPDSLGTTADGLLGHLSLLFVPAGVGVMVHVTRIGQDFVPIAAALLISTVAAITVTAVVFSLVSRLMGKTTPEDAA